VMLLMPLLSSFVRLPSVLYKYSVAVFTPLAKPPTAVAASSSLVSLLRFHGRVESKVSWAARGLSVASPPPMRAVRHTCNRGVGFPLLSLPQFGFAFTIPVLTYKAIILLSTR